MSDGENFSEFEQQIQPEGQAPADPPQSQDQPEALEEEGLGDPPEEGAEPGAPKPKKTAQERIDEITAARRTAEREAQYWRDVAEGRVKPNGGRQPKEEEAKAPNPDDFDLGRSDERYIEAVIDYRVKKGLDEVKGDVAQSLQVQAADRVWEAAEESARSKFDDYDKVTEIVDPVTGAVKWPCSKDAAIAIRQSDVGGDIKYHLASHPDEARRIYALPIHSQLLEIGRIAASVAKPDPAKTTNAPKPPGNQARGAGGTFAPNAATQDFSAFEAMANRKA